MAPLTRRRFLGGLGLTGGALLAGESPVAARTLWESPDFEARRVARIVPPTRALVGDVFKVRRTFPTRALDRLDPFLLLDHFDFTMAPGELGGLAPHPHRGFETVTLLFDGAMEHGDCLGHRGGLQAGDVQWMTAGRGIVHEENPHEIIRERGGRIVGIQLWVNLPRRAKWTDPAYQDVVAAKIPRAEGAGVRARVIAGQAHGVTGAMGVHTPLGLIDYILSPWAEVSLLYPGDWSAFVHVVQGEVTLGERRVGEAHLAHLGDEGGGVHLRNDTPRRARVLLGGGAPIGEPVARRGPFVMNTREEVRQAYADYRAGRMGRIDNPTYDRIRKR